MAITVEGIEEARRQFSRLSDKMKRGVLRTALRRAAQPIAKSAREHAPRATGALAKNIVVSVSVKQEGEAHALIGFRKRVYYGMFQELGTSKTPAHPFLRPALTQAGDEAVRVFGEQIKKQIDIVTARARQ